MDGVAANGQIVSPDGEGDLKRSAASERGPDFIGVDILCRTHQRVGDSVSTERPAPRVCRKPGGTDGRPEVEHLNPHHPGIIAIENGDVRVRRRIRGPGAKKAALLKVFHNRTAQHPVVRRTNLVRTQPLGAFLIERVTPWKLARCCGKGWMNKTCMIERDKHKSRCRNRPDPATVQYARDRGKGIERSAQNAGGENRSLGSPPRAFERTRPAGDPAALGAGVGRRGAIACAHVVPAARAAEAAP